MIKFSVSIFGQTTGYTVCPKKKATIRFDSHSAQSYQNSFIFLDIEDIHQEFLLVKFEDH